MFLHDQNHISMVYTALCLLAVLGDDYSRINKPAILKGLKALQKEDGR